MFVIIQTSGEPLRDAAGHLIVLRTRREAVGWLMAGERVEPQSPEMKDRLTP